eukprot:GHVT01032426.1.p3 GENE.GHVT01032426.1~~GHVT01032426.1.p3  ORF type:complete len:165 (+),score=16.96 GHVT01032426.1:3170-3664(+)
MRRQMAAARQPTSCRDSLLGGRARTQSVYGVFSLFQARLCKRGLTFFSPLSLGEARSPFVRLIQVRGDWRLSACNFFFQIVQLAKISTEDILNAKPAIIIECLVGAFALPVWAERLSVATPSCSQAPTCLPFTRTVGLIDSPTCVDTARPVEAASGEPLKPLLP